jgi:hypothetical protein
MATFTDWSTIRSIVTYFGSSLHGAKITWYNDPTADAANAARTELKVDWEQYLYARLYTWYSTTGTDGTDDAKFFKGNMLYDDTATGLIADPSVTGTPAQADNDIIFQLQLKNPVTSSTIAYTGMKYQAR